MRTQYALLIYLSSKKKDNEGTTLVELTIALSLAALLASVAGGIMFSQVKTTGGLTAIQSLRQEWNRTTHFIESEVALSQRVITNPNNVNLSQCTTTIGSSEFRFALDIRPDLPPSIYYVRSNQSTELRGTQSLYRCGPEIDREGEYIDSLTIDSSLLVDGMGENCQINPSTILPANSIGKSLRFELCLQGMTNGRYSQIINTYSRVNPLAFARPVHQPLCQGYESIESFTSVQGTTSGETITAPSTNNSILICGNGGADTINGSSDSDVLEINDNSDGSVLNGLAGNDRLVGGDQDETLNGGDGDDILISGSGDDILNGGNGSNEYVLKNGNKTITGGPNLDVIYLDINLSEISGGLQSCTQASCSITGESNGDIYSISASDVDVIQFGDGRYDIPSQ